MLIGRYYIMYFLFSIKSGMSVHLLVIKIMKFYVMVNSENSCVNIISILNKEMTVLVLVVVMKDVTSNFGIKENKLLLFPFYRTI